MVPEEWPIADEPADPLVDPALARGRGRLATVRRDFFLHPNDRLTEQERALMTAMLRDLIATLATSIRATVGATSSQPDPAKVMDTLSQAGLLNRAPLIRFVLRRADEHRILSAFANHPGPRRLPLLPALVSDSESDVSAAAMGLVVARGRRRDGFGQPRIDPDDLDPADAMAITQAVAAVLSPDPSSDPDYASAASRIVAATDPLDSLDAAVAAVIDALAAVGRADESLVEVASSEGELALVAQIIARRTGIDQPMVWDHLVDAGEGGVALIARMAGLGRRAAAHLIADLGSASGTGSIEGEIAHFDKLSAEEVSAALAQAQLPQNYRIVRGATGGCHWLV